LLDFFNLNHALNFKYQPRHLKVHFSLVINPDLLAVLWDHIKLSPFSPSPFILKSIVILQNHCF